MIIKLSQSSTEATLNNLKQWFSQQDVEAREVTWGEQILLVTSAKWKGDVNYLKSVNGVESVIEMSTEYQLCTRKFQSQDTVIDLDDDVVFGRGVTVMMAGPCAVESEDHTTLVAAVKAAGLVETLQGEGPFTVFAPVNDAFENLLVVSATAVALM